MKTHQHAPFLFHITHSQTRAMAIPPEGTVNRRQNRLRLYFADMPQGIEQHPLFDGHLCIRIQMLHGAAAAASGLKSEVFASGFNAQRRLFFNAYGAAAFITVFVTKTFVRHGFSGQCSFNENHFSVTMSNASTVLVKRLNINRKLLQYFRGSCHWKYPSKIRRPLFCTSLKLHPKVRNGRPC